MTVGDTEALTEDDDASAAIARSAAALRYEDLSSAVVDAAKRGILDTLAVCLAATGAAEEDVRPIRSLLEDSISPGGFPALGLGWPLTLMDNVFWFGALSHALDYDDYADIVHPSAPVVSAALPLAQAAGGVDGQRTIVAVALGQDLIIRIALALNQSLGDHGWLPALPGTLGAALTSAKVLDLNEDQIRSTLGLALHQTAGTMQALAGVGSGFRGVREGFNARAGVLSAQLAARGMRGDGGSFEGQFGLFNQFFQGDYDRRFFLSGLGTDLLGPRITFKPWPSAGHTHLFLTALSELRASSTFRAEDVRRVTVVGGSHMLESQCEPRKLRVAPPHGIDAKVSIPFLIGKLLRHGTVRIEDFSPEGLSDCAAIETAELVEWRRDPSFRRGEEGFGPAEVELELADGRRLSAHVEFNLGHPRKPLSWEQLAQKFRECLHFSAVDLPAGTADDVVDIVANLESVADVRVLADRLTPAVGSVTDTWIPPASPNAISCDQHRVRQSSGPGNKRDIAPAPVEGI